MSVVPACVLFNARSLRNKLSELHLMLYHDNPSLVFVTESWLDSSITDGMIDPQGLYCVYRHDRSFRVGGGVLALVSRRFQSYQIAIPDQE